MFYHVCLLHLDLLISFLDHILLWLYLVIWLVLLSKLFQISQFRQYFYELNFLHFVAHQYFYSPKYPKTSLSTVLDFFMYLLPILHIVCRLVQLAVHYCSVVHLLCTSHTNLCIFPCIPCQ